QGHHHLLPEGAVRGVAVHEQDGDPVLRPRGQDELLEPRRGDAASAYALQVVDGGHLARTYPDRHIAAGSPMMPSWSRIPLDSQVREMDTREHGTPHMGALAFADAGSPTHAWLHAAVGTRRTVMSAVDVYHEQSMRRLLGFMPARFTSRRVARLMADAAYDLARQYLARSERSARQRLLVGSAFESDVELAAAARAASA